MEPTAATWSHLVPRYADFLRSGTLSPRTVELRLYHLARIRRHLGVQPYHVTLEHLVDYSKDRDWAPNTRAVVRASMAVFFRWCHDNEYIEKNPAAKSSRGSVSSRSTKA